MKKKKLKRVSALALSLVMALSLTSLPVYAAEMESGAVDLTVNSSKVAFAGYEWWVIGKEGEGVYPQTGHITLLSANSAFGITTFRNRQDSDGDGYTQYEDGYWYASNPSGMTNWTTPNEYAGSTLQQYMESIPNNYSFPDEELALITARDITDGIDGQEIEDQKLWALSYNEWETIEANANGRTVLSYGNNYWLRSPDSSLGGDIAQIGYGAYTVTDVNGVGSDLNVARPAFSLNLESVLFTSAASEESGKSAVEVGNTLTSMTEISDLSSSTVKFTMHDADQTLTIDDYKDSYDVSTEETLYFTYSNATTGEDQYVSCVLTDENDDVKYYAKLTDSSSAESGNVSISLAGVEAGTYTLKIFSEQANDYLNTDFCSEPVTMTVTVSSESGTVGGNSSSTGTTTEVTTSDDSEAENDQDDSQTTSIVENPKTYDNIFLYFVLGTISLIGLISAGIYFRKNMKNKTR